MGAHFSPFLGGAAVGTELQCYEEAQWPGGDRGRGAKATDRTWLSSQLAGALPGNRGSELYNTGSLVPTPTPAWSRDKLSCCSLSRLQVCEQHSWLVIYIYVGFPGGSAGKESACNTGDPGSIPGSGRSTGEGIGYPL